MTKRGFMWRAVLAVLAISVLPGCLGGESPDPQPVEAAAVVESPPPAAAPADDNQIDLQTWLSPDWAIAALANGDEHDHMVWEHHANRTTPNFVPLGTDALATQRAGGTSGGYVCGDTGVDTTGRRIAVTQSHFDDVVLIVADVTDAHAPKVLAELVLEGFETYDSAITEDARYALIAVTEGPPESLTDPPSTVPAKIGWRDACGQAMGPMVKILPVASVLLVDLTTPTAPVIVDQVVFPGRGVHSVSTTTIGGVVYVAASALSLELFPLTPPLFAFYTIEEMPGAGATLAFFGVYDSSNTQSQEGGQSNFNDMHIDATIQQHPITGQVLAYLANWAGGMIIVDLVQPGVVRWQGEWDAGSVVVPIAMPRLARYQIHSTLPLDELWGDRHITIVGEENSVQPAGQPTGNIFILDTTDPAAPVEVARWTLPVDAGAWDTGLLYSPHYFDVIGTTVFVSMYHGGIWAFDASPENWPHPPSVGVYIPSEGNAAALPGGGYWAVMSYTPSLAEVIAFDDDVMVTFDSRGGIHTYRFQADERVEPVPSWFDQ